MFPTVPIYVDLAPLGRREKYQRIHGRFLDAIGLDMVREAAEILADRIPGSDKVEGFLREGFLPFGDETLKVSQANVIRNLLFGGRQMQLSWEWLKGSRNTADQAVTIGVRKDIQEPADFVNCLLNLGSVIHRSSGKKIVLLIDEAEALRSVTEPDSLQEITYMLRLLLENSNTFVGLVLGVVFAANIDTIRGWIEGLTGTELFAAEIYFLSKLPARIESGEVILVVAIALALSLLATIYPSWRAARLDPVEALRYE